MPTLCLIPGFVLLRLVCSASKNIMMCVRNHEQFAAAIEV